MDAKLKAKLNEVVDAALLYWKKTGGPGLKDVAPTTDPVVPTTDIETKALTRWLIKQARQKLYRTAEWQSIQHALANDALAQIFTQKLKARNRQQADDLQLPLPGYEHIPTRIRIGGTYPAIAAAPVAGFLKFNEKYQASVGKNRERAEELSRLAKLVAPFAETEPDIPVAAGRRACQRPGADRDGPAASSGVSRSPSHPPRILLLSSSPRCCPAGLPSFPDPSASSPLHHHLLVLSVTTYI